MFTALHDPALFTPVLIVAGLFVGSFLNVVIHRLPRMLEREWENHAAELRGEPVPALERYNLATPASHCSHCDHRIRPVENIPLISYLVLRGRCRQCRTPVSLRYPAVELLSATLAGCAAWHFGPGLTALGACVFLWALIALACIDFNTTLLPDSITLPLLWLGLTFNLGTTYVPLNEAVIGAMAGYLVLWSVFWLFKLVTGKEGMGHGDFKLLAAIGAWLGWQALPLVVLFASLTGAVIGIALIVLARHGRDHPIPFGPFLAIAAALALFSPDTLGAIGLFGL